MHKELNTQRAGTELEHLDAHGAAALLQLQHMEAAHVSIGQRCMKKKHKVAYTYRRTLFSLGRKGSSDTHYYLDEP